MRPLTTWNEVWLKKVLQTQYSLPQVGVEKKKKKTCSHPFCFKVRTKYSQTISLHLLNAAEVNPALSGTVWEVLAENRNLIHLLALPSQILRAMRISQSTMLVQQAFASLHDQQSSRPQTLKACSHRSSRQQNDEYGSTPCCT